MQPIDPASEWKHIPLRARMGIRVSDFLYTNSRIQAVLLLLAKRGDVDHYTLNHGTLLYSNILLCWLHLHWMKKYRNSGLVKVKKRKVLLTDAGEEQLIRLMQRRKQNILLHYWKTEQKLILLYAIPPKQIGLKMLNEFINEKQSN